MPLATAVTISICLLSSVKPSRTRSKTNNPTMIVTEIVPKHVSAVVSDASDDGESSVSSTVTVVHTSVEVVLEKQEPHQQDGSGYLHKKSVRFNEDRNKIYGNKILCKKDLQGLWYTSKDFKQFKAGTKCMAKEIARFEALNKAPHSYARVLQRAYQACLLCPSEESSDFGVLSSEEEKHMKKWMEISINRLGCERLSIRAIAHDRSVRRAEMSQTVFKLQELGNHARNEHYKTELIRRNCVAITRPSRLFARHLAKAQSESLHYV